MKQIKTILEPVTYPKCFDALVNCALIDGWTLTKREIITMPGELSEAFNASAVRYFYAELERYNPPFPEEITL